MSDTLQFKPMLPDVLGAVVPPGARLSMDTLQAAIGVFPNQAYLNQPFEVVTILQNMIDQAVEIKIGLQLPTHDDAKRPINLVTPKKMIQLTLKGGEVGVLRLPIVAEPPTQPGDGFPIHVAIRHRAARRGHTVRQMAGGAPPSVLAVSPFKMHVLRDIAFVQPPAGETHENVTLYFDIAPKRLPSAPQNLKPTYEALWTMEQLAEEREHIASKMEEARLVASTLTRMQIIGAITRAVDETFGLRGLPLHPGEAKAIAKMVTFTLDNNVESESHGKLEDTRWFQTLCQVLAYDPQVASWEPGEIAARYLFDAALYDAILMGFSIIRPRVRVNLGDRHERVNYANRMMAWLAGEAPPDLLFIYLPLAMGGVAVNAMVMGRNEDPWKMLDEMREAYRGRVRLASGGAAEVFDMLDKLLERGEDDLRRARVQRG